MVSQNWLLYLDISRDEEKNQFIDVYPKSIKKCYQLFVIKLVLIHRVVSQAFHFSLSYNDANHCLTSAHRDISC